MPEPINTPNNEEIDKALKEFEAKNTEQNQKAPEAVSVVSPKVTEGVQFETDSYKAVKFYKETATPKMIKLVMKISGGAVKSERKAEYVLLGFVVVAILISLYLFFGISGLGRSSSIDEEELQKIIDLHEELLVK